MSSFTTSLSPMFGSNLLKSGVNVILTTSPWPNVPLTGSTVFVSPILRLDGSSCSWPPM